MGKDKEFAILSKLISIQVDDRGLKINSTKKFEQYLLESNYFDFINGFETLLLKDKKDKNKGYIKGTHLNDFINLNKFDIELSKEVMACLNLFEKNLKSKVSYNFCSIYCNTLKDTMNYQNKSYYKCPSIGTYESKFFIKQYNNNLFSLISKYDKPGHKSNIGTLTYSDTKKIDVDYIDAYNNPPLWVIIKQLTFGELYIMVGLLDDKVLNPILSSYGLTLSDRDYFLNCLDVLKTLRNHCAHFELINRFRTHKNTDLSLIHRRHGVKVKSYLPTGPIYVMRLFDTLLVMSQFVDISKPLYRIIFFWMVNTLKGKHILNKRLLDRMSERNIYEWVKLLAQNY